jgi:hypothetical protein
MPQSWNDIAAMGLRLTIFVFVCLGCGAAAAEDVPLPRPRPAQSLWIEPHSFAEAAGPGFDSAAVNAEPSDCDKRLAAVSISQLMPRLIGPGACGGSDMVELDAVLMAGGAPIDIKPAPVLRCSMAESVAAWVRDDAAVRFAALGTSLQQIETYGDFDCRGRNRVAGGTLSEHGKGNAVDVHAFHLADGRRIDPTDAHVAKDLRTGLREGVCQRFTTVLGPGSDGYHEAHIHLDLAERAHGYRICEWDVREPLPAAAAVPLPQPRPAELAALDAQKRQ